MSDMQTLQSYGPRCYRGIGVGECTIKLHMIQGLSQPQYSAIEATARKLAKLSSVSIDPHTASLNFTVRLSGVTADRYKAVVDEQYLKVLGIALHKANPKKSDKLLASAKRALAS